MLDLWKRVAQTSGTQIYSLIASIAILTITARWLGPEGRGVIATVTTWVGLFSTVGCLSLGQVAIYRATRMGRQAWLGTTLGSLLLLDLTITLLGWIVAGGLYLATHGAAFNNLTLLFLIIGFLSLPLIIWEQYGSALLMAVDQVKIYNHAQITGRTVGLVLILIAWQLNWGVPGVLSAVLLSQTIVALIGLRYLFERSERPIRFNRTVIKELLKDGFKLHPNYVGGFLIPSSSILVINYYFGSVETGYYQAALQLVTVLLVIPQAASMVIYGKVTQLGPDAAWAYQRKVTLFLMLGMLGTAVVAATVAPWLIPFVLGTKFKVSIGLFQTLLLAILGMALGTMMNPQWVGRGLFGLMSVLTIILGIASLISTIILVPRYGVYSAAWTLVVIYLLSMLCQGWMILKCEAKLKSLVPSQAQVGSIGSL